MSTSPSQHNTLNTLENGYVERIATLEQEVGLLQLEVKIRDERLLEAELTILNL
jgi:hypothetical protein